MRLWLAVFAGANLAWLAATGVQTGGDTGIYIDGARRLLEGQPLVDRQPSYLGYVAVVAAFHAIGSGLIGIVLFQIAAATLAAGAMYRMAGELGGARTAMLATALLTVDLDTNRWHTYVLTDSLYLSMFVLAVWLVHLAAQSPRQPERYVTAIVAIVLAGLVRPEGWFLLPAAGLYWVVIVVNGRSARVFAAAGVVAVCLGMAQVVAPSLGGNVAAVGPDEMLRRGQTIWSFDGWRLDMPASSALGPVAYALEHPLATAELMVARLAVHMAHVRPFYSMAHNLVIVAWLVPIYALTAVAVWTMRPRALTHWCVLAFGSQAAVVALTHADWDGRYLAHVMPIVYPFAAAGFWHLVSRRIAFLREPGPLAPQAPKALQALKN